MNLRGAGPHPDFPNTRADLEHIQRRKINTLLEAYGIAVPADAELQDKRILFGRFIGVPL
ncbi:hypothetical protein M405DRAFT_813880 [Rhizopogon salebrosus TDB-379]|nr:hypothetical protein M405DRAFT_813880 [Rhizopogon salebrosus TDB-379]